MTDATGEAEGTKARPGAGVLVGRYVPISAWLPRYPRAWLGKDISAGITS